MLDTLRAQHYAHIPLRMSEEDLHEGARCFLRFLEEIDDDVKRSIHFKSEFHRGSAGGYSDVRRADGKDSKEYFHWTPQLKRHGEYLEVWNTHKKGGVIGDFLAVGEELYNRAAEMAWLTFQDEGFSQELRNNIFDECGGLVNAHLRFLCYTPTSSACRAKPHYDKGQGAIALAESCPGLRVGCCDEHPLARAEHREGHAIFMPGQLLWQQSSGTIIPAWHDVAHVDGVKPISDRCARWAIVFFINDRYGRYPEWDAVHEPLQVHGSIEPHEK